MIDPTNLPTSLVDFSGGLNTKRKELNKMKITETPDCMDVYSDVDGSLHKREGRTKLDSTQRGAGSYDSNILYDLGGTLFGMFGTSSFKMDELDGTFDALDTGLTDCKYFGANYSGTLVLGNYNYDIPRYWNGTAATTSAIADTDCPRARYPMEYQGYIFWWNVRNNPNRLQRSDYGTYDTYTATNYNDIITHDGDVGTGLAKLKGVLYAFKRWSIHRISYLGGTPLLDIRQMTTGIGAISHDTIRNITIPDKGEVLIFLGADKRLHIFDGYSPTPVSGNFEESNDICPIACQTLNTGGIKFAHAVVDESRHWYVLFVPNGGDSTMTHCFVYNYHTGACFPFANQTLASSVVATDTNGKKWVVVGDYSGYAFKWYYGNKDDTTTISAYHTIPRVFYKTPQALVKNRQVRIDMKALSDDIISFQHRQDYGETWNTAENIKLYTPNPSSEWYLGVDFVLGTSKLGPQKIVVHTTVDLPYISNFMQFKISDSLVVGPWTLYGYDFLGKAIGYGEQGSE